MITTITQRGQTVVPSEIRRKFHIETASRLEWIEDGGTIRVIPIPHDSIKGARGIAKGWGLSGALHEERRKERARG
ncbi:MAG: AbrB family transcriptional regulator [Verrucomicrobia bacterium]|nr:AbrB family transcriptional regulator [Verrucomicrobiota bacterium]